MNHWSALRVLLPLNLAFFGGCQPPPPAATQAVSQAWSATRTWTSSDGRTLEGSLVARLGEDGIIKRSNDGVLLRMPPRFLDPANLAYLREAFASGGVPTTLDGVWYVRTRFTIPGGEALMAADSAAAIGPRIAKVETNYWLLLSELDGSNAKWVRIDYHAYSKVREDSLLPHAELANQRSGSGAFLDEVPCPRTDLYIIDARYGLTSRRINVTRAMIGHLASGTLPVTVNPGLFGLPEHAPDVWDIAVTWQREGQGALTRVVRDGSILAWPELK
jgi:hypothetical protein